MRQGQIEISAGVLLIGAALFLMLCHLREASLAARSSARVLYRLSAALPEEGSAGDVLREPGENALEESTESSEMLPDYVLHPEMAMPVQTVDGMDYVASLSIPSLSLELPVADSWSYENLRVSPCRYTGTAYRSGMVIAAHNYRAHFGLLDTLSVGAVVVLTDMDGNKFHYAVSEITTLPATAIRDMTDARYDLTLFTCTVGGYARVTVRCMRTEEQGAPDKHGVAPPGRAASCGRRKVKS
ncbi:sortase [Lachnoclostridium sp. Marseille-P6806]|uniref:sortase n=1 Tax=Lachnoclostridium sp. Marseille-P6806 TaxID=2364793 RepID=UPI0013EF4A90|nr:sortase [Lachnoclostridium sp. Marseille-P6806]